MKRYRVTLHRPPITVKVEARNLRAAFARAEQEQGFRATNASLSDECEGPEEAAQVRDRCEGCGRLILDLYVAERDRWEEDHASWDEEGHAVCGPCLAGEEGTP